MYHSAKLWGQRGQQGKDRGDYQSDRIKKFTDFKIERYLICVNNDIKKSLNIRKVWWMRRSDKIY